MWCKIIGFPRIQFIGTLTGKVRSLQGKQLSNKQGGS